MRILCLQMIHMKYQDLFSLKNKKEKIKNVICNKFFLDALRGKCCVVAI